LDRSPDSPCLHSGPNSAAPKIINPAHKPANQQRRSPVGGDKPGASLLENATRVSNKAFQSKYKAAGGYNGVFNFPDNGLHTWQYWGAQLQAMLPDLRRVLGAG
ncbi:alpha/beta hydrolase-fold protein, partial [Mycobacterium ulcerans]